MIEIILLSAVHRWLNRLWMANRTKIVDLHGIGPTIRDLSNEGESIAQLQYAIQRRIKFIRRAQQAKGE